MLTRFGTETEFFGIGHYDAVERLRAAGLQAEDDGYHHEAKQYWRVTEDSSVNGEGCELVSPILRRTTASNVRKALDAIRGAGAVVDSTCGLHVHHDAGALTAPEIAEGVALYAYFQPTINTILHPYRVGNSYGMPMHQPWDWRDNILVSAESNDGHVDGYGFGRYHAINLQALRCHGTLEFRQHAGTLSPDVTLSWVHFTRLFMDAGLNGLTLEKATEIFGPAANVPVSIPEMGLFLGADANLIDALEARAAYYAKGSAYWDEEDRNLSTELDGYGEPYCGHCDYEGHSEEDCEERGYYCDCWDCVDTFPRCPECGSPDEECGGHSEEEE